MSRPLSVAVFLVFCFTAAAGSAVAGTCPSGANYVTTSLSNPGGPLVTLANLGVTSCFYVSAGGSDSNSGASESIPWLHAPGMPSCSAVCASHNPAPGEGFIFRGGDTWHFGNSSASPYTGGFWDWPSGGSSGQPIYIGVDLSWFSGSSWSRPILSGDNPVTPNPGAILDYVSGCAYQVPNGNNFVDSVDNTYTIFDYFEFTGMCQSDTGQPSGHDEYLNGFNSASTTTNWIDRVYMHGWTHTQWSVSNAPANANLIMLGIGSAVAFRYVVVDGSDSDPGADLTFPAGAAAYDVAYSVFRYTAEIIGEQCHVFHDNLVEHWAAEVHPNIFECVGESPGTGAYYNNVFRHLCTDLDPNGVGLCAINPAVVGIWPEPDTTTTDYYFNNLIYDVSGQVEYFNVGQNSVNQGSLVIFNNTMESANSPIFGCVTSGFAFPTTLANNVYITDSIPYGFSCAGQLTGSPITELIMSHATAITNGYMASQTYAYSPTSANSPTVGIGTNEGTANKAFCSALLTAAKSDPSLSDAATACQNDTHYACTYNQNNHTVTCPARTAIARPAAAAWDVGAYQFGASQSSPNPPTGLTAIVH